MRLPVNILSERIDDIVLLLHVMMQMELPQLLNEHLPRHWKQKGLDWGWVIVIWLVLLTENRCAIVQEPCQAALTVFPLIDLRVNCLNAYPDKRLCASIDR
jgi:hypothetical protein